ncbi:MAG: alpha/beta fold hydrolase, partial [Chloroflexi bacterium]|nr:alpha/beta fold hydrolase [Chloroflexota bacterium]
DYTTSYADAFARWGYLVLHPNLRNYPPSSEGDNLYRVGMAIDVFNLLALVGTHGGQPGPLQLADPANIGLWGHSMGGGVTTRVITVNPAGLPPVKAAVLYAAMSGDEAQNFEAIYRWSDGLRGEEELNTPPETLALISPAPHFERITAAVRIHHGRADELVPLRWSRQTCEQLLALEKDAVCVFHAEQPHTFYGEGNQRFIEQTVDFFNAYLRAP